MESTSWWNTNPLASWQGRIRARFGPLFEEGLFFLGLIGCFLYSYCTYFNLTTNTEIVGYETYLVFFDTLRRWKFLFLLCALAKTFFFSDWKGKELTAIGIFLLLLFLISRRFWPNLFHLYLFSFVFAARGIPYRRIAKVYLGCFVLSMLGAFLLTKYGLLEDVIVFRSDELPRHSFGLVHPNSFGLWTMMIVLCVLQAYANSLNWSHYGVLLAFELLSFHFTNSRASLLATLMLLIGTPIANWCTKRLSNTKIFSYLAILLLLVLVIFWFSISLSSNPESPLYSRINQWTSGRINLSRRGLTDFPFSFFGHNVQIGYVVDNLYVYTEIIYGLLGLALFLGITIWSLYRSGQFGCLAILVASVVLILYNTQENVFLYHILDVTLFAATAQLDTVSD